MAVASISKSLTRLCRGGGGGGGGNGALSSRLWSCAFSTSAPSLSSAVSDSQSTSSSQNQGERDMRSIWSKMFLFLPGAITFGLGTWQIFRRQDKINTLEFRHKRLELEPLKFNELTPSSDKMETLEFRRVACKGVFDEERTIFLGPRSRSISGVTENGYYVITPLLPIPNDSESIKAPILVNRGWVPRSWRDKSFEISRGHERSSIKASHSVQDDEKSSWWRFWSKKPQKVVDQIPDVTAVEVIGVVRGSEKPSMFVPENDPNASQWFYVDVPAIARASGLPESTVYVEDINENVDPSNPYPVPKDANALIRSSVMPQDHLNYTLTWYSLSAAVTFMAFKRLRPKRNWRQQAFTGRQIT